MGKSFQGPLSMPPLQGGRPAFWPLLGRPPAQVHRHLNSVCEGVEGGIRGPPLCFLGSALCRIMWSWRGMGSASRLAASLHNLRCTIRQFRHPAAACPASLRMGEHRGTLVASKCGSARCGERVLGRRPSYCRVPWDTRTKQAGRDDIAYSEHFHRRWTEKVPRRPSPTYGPGLCRVLRPPEDDVDSGQHPSVQPLA